MQISRKFTELRACKDKKYATADTRDLNITCNYWLVFYSILLACFLAHFGLCLKFKSGNPGQGFKEIKCGHEHESFVMLKMVKLPDILCETELQRKKTFTLKDLVAAWYGRCK